MKLDYIGQLRQFDSDEGGVKWTDFLGPIGGVISGIAGLFSNKSNNDANMDLYKLQHEDAIRDWNMQNEYNLPQNQMARLKAAGLNPNLVYGGGAGAMQSSASISRAAPAPHQNLDGSGLVLAAIGALNTMAQKDLIEAQTDNTKTQKRATEVNTARTEALMPFDLTAAGLKNAQTATEIDVLNDRNQREEMQRMQNAMESGQRIAESVERIAAMQIQKANTEAQTAKTFQETMNARTQGKLLEQALKTGQIRQAADQIELDMQKDGIQKGDPFWMRYMGKKIGDLFRSITGSKE